MAVMKPANNQRQKILVICGFIFIGVAVLIFAQNFFLHRNWPRANATITSRPYRSNNGGSAGRYGILFDANGQSIATTVTAERRVGASSTGSNVDIRYNPSNPYSAVNVSASYRSNILFMFVAFNAIGLLLLRYSKKYTWLNNLKLPGRA